MNFFEELFLKTGYRQDFIANKLDIQKKTLQNWLKLKSIDYAVKFLELIYICKIDIHEFLNAYYKTSKYRKYETDEPLMLVEQVMKDNKLEADEVIRYLQERK